MQILKLFARDRRLNAEVEVAESLHRGQAGTAHRGLQAALIAQRDMTAEHFANRVGRGELSAVGAAENIIERLQGAGHLEIGELGAQAIPECRRHQRPAQT